METGVACVGAFDEEAFDQRDDIQVSNASAGGLGESVSFGRFSADTLSWVKRSSFNHNQYLEEVGTCSTPGSVRQKKAYFEAYYKAIAKRKALEKALAEGNVEGHKFENLDGGVHDNEQQQQFSPAIDTSDIAATNNPNVFTEEITADAGSPQEHLSMGSPRQEEVEETSATAKGLQRLDSEPQALNFESQESISEGAAQDSMVESAEEPLHIVFSESCENDEHEPVRSAKECEEEEDTLVVSDTDELGEENAYYFQDEKQESVPQFNGSAHTDRVDDRRDAEIHDKFETNGLPRPETPKSFDLMETLPQSVDEDFDLEENKAKKVSAPKQPSQSVDQRQKEKRYSSTVINASNVPTKDSDDHYGSAQKSQGIGSVGEVRSHQRSVSSGNSRTNITVPQPFALATDKRASLVGQFPEQDGAKVAGKPGRVGQSLSSLVAKRAQASAKPEKKSSAHKSLAEESKKKQEKCEQQLEAQNESKQDDVTQSALALPFQTKIAGKTKGNQFKKNSNAFNFKSDERAEKRKEFNSKLEARLTAKETEKNQAEAKTQEEAVEEIKQLRKSLNFKATPMPNFYQESTQPKMDMKKAGIPTTRAKSPKLGRRSCNTACNTGLNSANLCLGSTSKQVKHVGTIPYNNTNSAETSNDGLLSRNVSVMPKKTTKKTRKTVLPAESSNIQPCDRQNTKLVDGGNFSRCESNPSDPHEVDESKASGLLDDCPTNEVFEGKSNTAADANDTIQDKDIFSVENSADDKKYYDVKKNGPSNRPSCLERLDNALPGVSNTMANTREENDDAAEVHCSSVCERKIPTKDPHCQNGVSAEKLKGEMVSRKDCIKSAVPSVNSSKRATKNSSTKDFAQSSDK